MFVAALHFGHMWHPGSMNLAWKLLWVAGKTTGFRLTKSQACDRLRTSEMRVSCFLTALLVCARLNGAPCSALTG